MVASTLAPRLRYAGEIVLEDRTCGECGITFAAPQVFWKERREDERTWYCPNGHPRAFIESSADVARREAERLKQENARLAEEAERERRWRREAEATAKRSKHTATAYKGIATKTRARAARGLCPVCNRFFLSLHNHVAHQHPDFVAEPVLPDDATPAAGEDGR